MNLLVRAYEKGRDAALARWKLAGERPTNPVVQRSALLSAKGPSATLPTTAQQQLQAPTSPDALKQVFNVQEQGITRGEPARKLGGENLCTTCRKPKHYGACAKPVRTRAEGAPMKSADFNLGMTGTGTEPAGDNADSPSTSPHYHSATVADSALARARDGRPADEQAATGFADLFRHLGISAPADEPGRMSGGLNKVGKMANFRLPGSEIHSLHEDRGPSVNVYEERPPQGVPPVGWGDEGEQRIKRMFDQIDGAVDSTNIEGASQPDSGPAALG